MQTHRLFSTAAAILGLTCTAARADLYMELGINKRFFQTAGTSVKFDHGELNLYLRDGNILLAFCTSDPQLYFYGPHILGPLGITGFVAWGDFNRDGVSDANQYWSIDSVVGAQVVAPSYPQLCSLVSAPPSKLPRPLRVFRDGAVTVFHDLRTAQVRQYDIALYEMVRRYGSVRQVETIVTAGVIEESGYINITVTGIDFPTPIVIPVDIDLLLDEDGNEIPQFAEEWAGNVRIALQANAEISAVYSVGGEDNSVTLTEITPNGNDVTLRMDITGGDPDDGGTTTTVFPLTSLNTTAGVVVKSAATSLKQMNEELVNGRYIFAFPSRLYPTTIPVNMAVTIVPNVEAYNSIVRQKGVGFRFTTGNFDEGFYQMDPRTLSVISWTGNDVTNIVPGDQIFFSMLNKAEDRIEFPPTVPQTPVLLANPAVQSYTLPPGFFQVGDEKVLDLRFQRNLGVTAVTFDRSQREYRMHVKMVDTYAGWGQTAFPLGTSADTSPTGDIDGDQMTNIEEYAYQFPTQAQVEAAAKAQLPTFTKFTRLLNQEAETVNDETVQPEGPIGPELDDEGHVVYKVPYRALTGNSLKYEFVEITTNAKNKTKTKKIKPGSKWLVSFEDGETALRSVYASVQFVDPATGVVSSNGTYGPIAVSVTQQYIVLRSKDPFKGGDLPNIGVKLTPVSIQ